MNKLIASLCLSFTLVHSQVILVHAQEWKRIDDRQTLEKIYVDKALRGIYYPTANRDFQHLDTNWQIDYCADGTGILTFWEQKTPRTWEITADDEVCISTQHGKKCYFCEENMKYKDIYRCGVVGKREAPWVFAVQNEKPESCP